MTEARRTLDWEKQLSLSIDPENARKIHYRHDEQHKGNNVPCYVRIGLCIHNVATAKKIQQQQQQQQQQHHSQKRRKRDEKIG